MSEHQHVSYIWIFPLWIYLTKSAVNTHQKFKLIYLLLNCIFCLRIFEEQSFFFVFLGTIQRSILILFRRNSPLFSLWSLATIVCDTCVISAVNETCECILELSFHWIKRNRVYTRLGDFALIPSKNDCFKTLACFKLDITYQSQILSFPFLGMCERWL